MQRIKMSYSSQTLVRQSETMKNAENNKLKRKSESNTIPFKDVASSQIEELESGSCLTYNLQDNHSKLTTVKLKKYFLSSKEFSEKIL